MDTTIKRDPLTRRKTKPVSSIASLLPSSIIACHHPVYSQTSMESSATQSTDYFETDLE
ncbi:MAG: hypothetical protein HQL52_04700 [Magnetococcales bacterium]|nr:hypothetical protein [Magnetococcales bacterium]